MFDKHEFDQIIIIEDSSYGFLYFSNYPEFRCIYIGTIPNTNILKSTLKKIYPNTSIVSLHDNRWFNLRKDIRHYAMSFYSYQKTKPKFDFKAENREAKINYIE